MLKDYEQEHYELENEHGHENFKKFKKICEATVGENISITAPVAIHAGVNAHDVEIECKGHEIIREPHCSRNVKKFKVRQKISVCIPLDFFAEVDVREGRVDFD